MPVTFENHSLRLGPFRMPVLPSKESKANLPYTPWRKYWLDRLAQELLEVIYQKGIDLPGIQVSFYTDDDPFHPKTHLTEIAGGAPGQQWRIRYGRAGFTTGQSYDRLLPDVIQIPKQILTLSDCSYTKYAGVSWKDDEDGFFNGCNVHEGMYGKWRTYFKYKSVYRGDEGRFVGNDDLGREYTPDGSKHEPLSFSHKAIFVGFTTFLLGVIDEIKKMYPDSACSPEESFRKLSEIERVPVPEGTPRFVVLSDAKGEKGILVQPEWRLCALNVQNAQETPFPKEAYRGFAYGYPQFPYDMASHLKQESWPSSERETWRPVAVTLQCANDVFVVDEAHLLAKRTEAWDRRLRSAFKGETGDVLRAELATTMVPLADYKGGYQSPVYLVGRPLGTDEAVLLEGDIYDRLAAYDGFQKRFGEIEDRLMGPSLGVPVDVRIEDAEKEIRKEFSALSQETTGPSELPLTIQHHMAFVFKQCRRKSPSVI